VNRIELKTKFTEKKMEVFEIIESIYQELIKNIGKIEWINSKITAELFGTSIGDFTLNLTMVAECDSEDISDETVGFFAEKHNNIKVDIDFTLFDQQNDRLIFPFQGIPMRIKLENKIKNYLKD